MPPLLAALLAFAPPAGDADRIADPAWLHVRGGLPWTKFYSEAGAPVRIAFLGGSITEGDGYRPLVGAKLRAKFPEVAFEFHNAGVASTGSTTGVFRFYQDAVLAGGAWVSVPDKGTVAANPSLVIAEAAVNDDQDERLSEADAAWNMEGIARSDANPLVAGPDLLFVHFVNPSILATVRAGGVPASVAAHERVAEHYGIPSVNVAAEVARRIDAGTLTWDRYGGTHPGPTGHELAAELIAGAIAECLERTPKPRFPPNRVRAGREPLRPDSLDGAFLTRPGSNDAGDAKVFAAAVAADGAWTTGAPDWRTLPGACRDRFRGEPLLHTTTPGATLTLDPAAAPFPFTALGLYVLAGPDAGAVDVTIGDGEPRRVELYHDPHSAGLHYPRTVLLYRAATPPAGPITVTTAAGSRGGTAVRVVGVAVGMRAAE